MLDQLFALRALGDERRLAFMHLARTKTQMYGVVVYWSSKKMSWKILSFLQGAKNNNNFDTTSEIMFLALDPPPRQPKKSKICSEQTIIFF